MQNVGLDESQAGIKITGRNSSNLGYADDNTLMVGTEEELSLLMRGKEESEKAGLKLNNKQTKIRASGSITSWQIEGETVEAVTNFIFLSFKITVDGDYSHEIKKCLLPWKESYDNLDSILKSKGYHFVKKCLYSQSYDFSSSHV